jgi:hypothetical protein
VIFHTYVKLPEGIPWMEFGSTDFLDKAMIKSEIVEVQQFYWE